MLTMWNDYCLVELSKKSTSDIIYTEEEKCDYGVVLKAPNNNQDMIGKYAYFNPYTAQKLKLKNYPKLEVYAVKLQDIICVE